MIYVKSPGTLGGANDIQQGVRWWEVFILLLMRQFDLCVCVCVGVWVCG